MAVKLPRTILLHADEAIRQGNKAFVASLMEQLDTDKVYEVSIQEYKGSKTLLQLNTLFGLWFDYMHKELGISIKDLHRDMKATYLVHIYVNAQEGKQSYLQIMWVNELARIGDLLLSPDPVIALQAEADMLTHMENLSLSWASISQMRQYMEKVYWHFANEGYPPPIPDKFYKYYKDENRSGLYDD